MTCEESVRSLHLHRPGERNEAEQRALELHLSACTNCATEAMRLARTQELFDKVTMLRPAAPADVSYILSAIEAARASRRTLAERIVQLWGVPSVRYSYALAAAATIVVAFVQLASSPSAPTDGPERTGRAYVAIRVEAETFPNAAGLSDDVRKVLESLSDGELRQDDARAALQRAGQVTLQSFRLTSDQQRMIERLLTQMRSNSLFRVRLGILGG